MRNITTPTGAYPAQRDDVPFPFNGNLFDQVLAAENLKRAWKQVRANQGAAGVDGMTVDNFLDWARLHWQQCNTPLQNGSYRPHPVKRVEIAKPDGGKRPLGIPTVLDRVIQQAITQILTPLFDPGFSPNSFGFRPHRNAQQAVKQVHRFIKQKRDRKSTRLNSSHSRRSRMPSSA